MSDSRAGGGADAGWAALAALTRREWMRFARQPSRVVAAVGTPALLWVFLASGFGSGVAGAAGGYGAHLVPGMVGLTVVFSSIFGAISLIEDRTTGFLQGVLASPAPRWSVVGSKVVGGASIAVLQGAILLPAAALVGATPGVAGFAAALGALACLSLVVLGLSLGLAWRVNSVSGFHGVMNLVLMPMWLLSGSFFPVAGAAPWLRGVMLANPLTWPTEALRASLGGGDGGASLTWALAVVAALASVAFASWIIGRGRPG